MPEFMQKGTKMASTVGTREWAMKSNGALGDADRRRLMAQAMLMRLAALPQRWRRKLGLDERALARVDAAAIRLPDSADARRAASLVQTLSAPWLVNHCMRTYLWGAILAQAGRIRFDEELFFVASALHDLGLTDKHDCGVHCAACFAVAGARAAATFADEAGWQKERRDRLSEAISLHLNVRVGLKHGAEAHLLHEGAMLDVIGVRRNELHAGTVQAVLVRYPRLGFKAEIGAAMKEQAASRPESRAAFLVGLGFTGMIRKSPWPE